MFNLIYAFGYDKNIFYFNKRKCSMYNAANDSEFLQPFFIDLISMY